MTGERDLMAAIVTGVLGLAYLVGVTVFVITAFLRTGRALDGDLIETGLSARRYFGVGRQFHGVLEDREVRVLFMPSYGITPALFDAFVSADLGTRIAMARVRPLLDCRDCAQLQIEDSELDHLRVYAQDEALAQRLVADLVCREAIIRLTDDEGMGATLAVYLQPERIWLRARPRRIAEGQVQQMLDDLLLLARAGEIVVDYPG
jgi:hypothetical protein